MLKFSVTKDGKPLDPSLYNWDEKTKTFSTEMDGLVLDFSRVSGATFKTGSRCSFRAHANCVFKTGSYCTFKTANGCTFRTGPVCTFNTWRDCIFLTGWRCTFTAEESNCVAIRDDINPRFYKKEVIELPPGKTILTGPIRCPGYAILPPKDTATEEDCEKPEIEENIEDLFRQGTVIEIAGNKYRLSKV